MLRLISSQKRSAGETEPSSPDTPPRSGSKWDQHYNYTGDWYAGAHCVGAAGSGKSSGPSADIALAHLRAGFAGILTSAKPTDQANG